MPKRSSNAGQARRSGSSQPNVQNRRRQSAQVIEPEREPMSSAANDILGVCIAVTAIALLISLVSPSNAPVTRAVGEGLTLCFGAGAWLVPVALFLYAVSFFVSRDDENTSFVPRRIAAGLTLVVLAILSILSCLAPGASQDVMAIFSPDVLRVAGGYVGGAVAWLGLSLFGKQVSLVVLFGLAIAGVIVCGFSISDVVSRARERLQTAREQHSSLPHLGGAAAQPFNAMQTPDAVASDEVPATTYLGERKTSVLRRDTDGQKTTKLSRRRSKNDSKADATKVEATAKTKKLKEKESSPQVVIPEFLREGAKSATEATTKLEKGTKGRSSRPSKRKDVDTKKDEHAQDPHGVPVAVIEKRDESLPPMSILQENPNPHDTVSSGELSETAQKLQSTLEEFGVSSQVVGWTAGPSVTTFKIEMGEGERVNKIRNLEDDIALSLAARSVRIFAPIPGTSYVGIEIPNKKTQAVFLGDVLPSVSGGPLEAAFGRDSEGRPVIVDIARLPHLLVAGTTGSGKSVLLNSIVMSMLMRATPDELRLIMVDPKRVEFTFYAGLPHLYVPVVTEPRQAASALQWAVSEMERRLKTFEHYKVRDIGSYNKQVESGRLAEMENPPSKMPFFVIVIDELSDLMMVAGKDVEASIVRIAQLGRAAGIHLIVATQRPSADVVTGLIKANIDNRVALSVDNSINSRIILDQVGAEKLLGRGDMLYKLRGKRPQRAQACFVSETEVEEAVSFIKEHHEADYHEDILSAVSPSSPTGATDLSEDDDPLVWEAAQIVVDSQMGSTSGLQRRLKVGYARAGRIMDMLEQKGVVGPQDGSKPREVLLDADGLEELRSATAAYREV